ncbi:MAG TPA: hypothetical protein VMS02_01775, partial [Solirubrobacteraceae bacterium]|nr:hypothetical protein [Solirubrobacteraceae bacterium]
QAKRWIYTARFETDAAAQDTVWLQLGFNFTAVTGARGRTDTLDPFAALAELVSNLPAIRTDLLELLRGPAALAADEAARKRARSAVLALAELSAALAATWGPVTAAPQGDSAAVPPRPEQTLTFTLKTQTRPGADGRELIDALVLERGEGTTSWGPQGREPLLGYVDDDGALQLLSPQDHLPQAPQLVYRPPPAAAVARARRVFAIAYRDLDALTTQNARATVWIARNDRLAPQRSTAPAFVYRTPATTFAEICSPGLVRDQPIAFGAGTLAGLATALETLFVQLLGAQPTQARAELKLTVRQGFRLTAPGEDDEEGIYMLSPVAFRPLFSYAATVPGEIVTALRAARPLAEGVEGVISLELAVFSTLLPAQRQPLLELLRLDYRLVGGVGAPGVMARADRRGCP